MTNDLSWNSESLREWIRPVEDPDIGVSLLDLGLIYSVTPESDGVVKLVMTLTSPACPAGDFIKQALVDRLLEYPGVKTPIVELVWEPKWDPKEMASEEVKERLGIW